MIDRRRSGGMLLVSSGYAAESVICSRLTGNSAARKDALLRASTGAPNARKGNAVESKDSHGGSRGHSEGAKRPPPGQDAESMTVELTGIDPWRMALLLLPLGAIAGGVHAWAALRHERHPGYFVIVPLLFVSVGAFGGWLAGLLQAALFNFYVQIMRRGPVLHLRKAAARRPRHAWLADREDANRRDAREFVRNPERTRDAPPGPEDGSDDGEGREDE